MKKGDASMVAFVLLIVAAIVVGVLVTTFSVETEKRVEKRIITMGDVLECESVGIGLNINVDGIKIRNKGTLGIGKVFLRQYPTTGGDTTTKKIGAGEDVDMTWDLGEKLLPGEIYPMADGSYVHLLSDTTFDKIEFIPIIIIKDNEEMGCEKKIVTWEK